MKRIYEEAAAVYAWLGLPHDDEEIKLGVTLMRSFNQYMAAGLELHHGDTDAVLADIDSRTPGFPSTEDSDEWKAWMGIAEMMSRDYWSRTWVQQEATTPGEIWFYCGEENFNDVHLAATSAFGTEFSVKCPQFDGHFSDAIGHASIISRLSSTRIQREGGSKRSLVDLVEEVRPTDCSDERDKAYAVLGHATDIESSSITPDYNQTLKTVYADLVRLEMTKKDPDLRILEHVHIPASDSSNETLSEVLDPLWPSWIPDWRQWITLVPLYPKDEERPPLVNPSPGSEVVVEFNGDVMSVEGSTLSEIFITYLTPICEESRDVAEVARSWYKELMSKSSLKNTDESIRKSLVCDANRVLSQADGKRRLVRGYTVNWDSLPTDSDMLARVSNVCLGRRMGIVDSGHTGIFPAAAQNNDVVSVFHGGHTLYLLRPISDRDNHFRFIGPCYVDGLMDGRAIRPDRDPRMLHLV